MALARSVAQSWSGLGFLGGRGAPSRPAIIFRLLGAADNACRVRLAAADSVRAAGAAAAPTGQRCGVGTARPLHPFSAWSLSLSPHGLPGPASKQPAPCVRTGRRRWPRLSDPGRPGSCGSCRHALRFVKTESGSTSPLASHSPRSSEIPPSRLVHPQLSSVCTVPELCVLPSHAAAPVRGSEPHWFPVTMV